MSKRRAGRRWGFAVTHAAAFALGLLACALPAAPAAAAEAGSSIRIGYLGKAVEDPRPAAYGLPPTTSDEGVQGARLGLDENNSTGRFSGQQFALTATQLAEGEDVAAAVRAFVAGGTALLIADLPAAALDQVLATPEAAGMLIFNAGAADDRFRNQDCRAFLLHTLPSRAMLADALAQYLVKKNWRQWFLVMGGRPGDALYADAFRRAAGRFGGTIVADKRWGGSHDARRTAIEEIPLFTQGVRYDVLVVADEAGIFGDLFLYRTWDARPVAGTQGLVASAWHDRMEQWGAAQLQARFFRQAGRPMTSRDYAAWLAVRSIGEAATRTRSGELAAISAYLHGPEFELAAFKGRKLSYRAWDGQLRQPIPLGWTQSVVSVSPQEGFLHQVTELDTLGYDAPESGCHAR